MSLRTKLFALTYDRQMARNREGRAACHARQRLLAGASRRRHRDRRRDRAQPALLRPGSQVADDHRARAADAAAPGAAGPRSSGPPRRSCARRPRISRSRITASTWRSSTLVLCGVDDQPRALRELRRVLRPGGRLLFLEHLRSDDPALARLQDRMNWLNRLVVCCDCNRPTLDSIRQRASPSPSWSTRRCRRPRSSCARPSWATPWPPRPRSLTTPRPLGPSASPPDQPSPAHSRDTRAGGTTGYPGRNRRRQVSARNRS